MRELIYMNKNNDLVWFNVEYTDKYYRTIHILDIERSGTKKINNNINDFFLMNICKDLDIKFPERVFLYGINGTITEWENNEEKFLNSIEINKYGFEDFIRESIGRKAIKEDYNDYTLT